MIRETDKEWIRLKDDKPHEGQKVLIAILSRPTNAPWRYSGTQAYFFRGEFRAMTEGRTYVTPEFWRPWPDLPFVEDFGEARSW